MLKWIDDQSCDLALPIWIQRLSQRTFVFLSVLAIVALTMAVYSQILYSRSVDNEFVNFDDSYLILNNKKIRSLSLENLVSLFTPRPGSTYQPIRNLSYAIDYHFWQLNPVGYQIFNLFLHCASGIILFFTLRGVLSQLKPSFSMRFSLVISLFSALLFVAHPINVESVAWVSSRKYVLLVLFSLCSFFAYSKCWRQSKCRLPWFFISCFCVFIAVLSSPFGVAVPALFFLFDYCRDSSNNPFTVIKQRFWAYLPYLLAGLWVVPTLLRGVLKGRFGGAETAHFQGNP